MDVPTPPGYRRTGKGSEIVLVDPEACPDGHPFPSGGQRGYTPCAPHHGHPYWRCGCGQLQFLREDGVIVTELHCR